MTARNRFEGMTTAEVMADALIKGSPLSVAVPELLDLLSSWLEILAWAAMSDEETGPPPSLATELFRVQGLAEAVVELSRREGRERRKASERHACAEVTP